MKEEHISLFRRVQLPACNYFNISRARSEDSSSSESSRGKKTGHGVVFPKAVVRYEYSLKWASGVRWVFRTEILWY